MDRVDYRPMLCNAVVVWLRVALWTVEVDVVVMMVVDDDDVDDAMATSLDILVVEDMPNDEEEEELRTFPHNTLNICMRVGGSNKVMNSKSSWSHVKKVAGPASTGSVIYRMFTDIRIREVKVTDFSSNG